MIKRALLPVAFLLAVGGGLALVAARPADADPPAKTRVFELRTYTCNPGKLADLHKRFREHTCALFQKHGIELVGFWTPQDEKDGKADKLIYIVAFPTREAAKKSWADFQADPEWQRVYKESHKDGKLVDKVESVYMEPTDYSAIR
jgi:hypothetical protein